MTFQAFCYGALAISNCVMAWSFYKFSNVGVHEMKQIRRSTDVVRYHILRGVLEKKKTEWENGERHSPGK